MQCNVMYVYYHIVIVYNIVKQVHKFKHFDSDFTAWFTGLASSKDVQETLIFTQDLSEHQAFSMKRSTKFTIGVMVSWQLSGTTDNWGWTRQLQKENRHASTWTWLAAKSPINEVSNELEQHRTKWWMFLPAMFDYRRVPDMIDMFWVVKSPLTKFPDAPTRVDVHPVSSSSALMTHTSTNTFLKWCMPKSPSLCQYSNHS